MKKEFEKFGLLTEEISDENIDFEQLQKLQEEKEEDGDDVLKSVEDPKIQESFSSVSADDRNFPNKKDTLKISCFKCPLFQN